MKTLFALLLLSTLPFAPPAQAYPESHFNIFVDFNLEDDTYAEESFFDVFFDIDVAAKTGLNTNPMFDIFFNISMVGLYATDFVSNILFDMAVVDSANSRDSFFDIFYALKLTEDFPINPTLNISFDVSGPTDWGLLDHFFFMIESPQSEGKYSAFSLPLGTKTTPNTEEKDPLPSELISVNEPLSLAIAALGLFGLTMMRYRAKAEARA